MLKIPHSRPLFGKQFETATAKVIQSGFLAQGLETKALEHVIQNQLQQRHVLAVDSGTNALMLAIRYLIKNKENARIGLPSYACASILFAVKAAGAQPVFIDCNEHLCLDKNKTLAIAGTLDALILVHPFGKADPLATENFPCPVIEDIAQSVGANIGGKAVGTFTEISIGSLYATKPWGGAYGGYITSPSKSVIKTVKQMCDPDQADIHLPYAGHHQLSNLHATIAKQRINQSIEEQQQRQLLAKQYNQSLQNRSAEAIQTQQGTTENHFRYIIRCQDDAKNVITKFRALGVGATRPVQQPLHLTNTESTCPCTLDLWQHCVSLPMLANMSEKESAHMQLTIKQCL